MKQRPEDFFVYEIPMYEPCGEGEHIYVRIRKVGISHDELISTVARAWGVQTRDIGFAGIKDTQAVTEQTLSIHLPSGEEQRRSTMTASTCSGPIGMETSCDAGTSTGTGSWFECGASIR